MTRTGFFSTKLLTPATRYTLFTNTESKVRIRNIIFNDTNFKIVIDIFEIKDYFYSLRCEIKLKSRKIKIVRYGTKTAPNVDPRLRNSVPDQINYYNSLK